MEYLKRQTKEHHKDGNISPILSNIMLNELDKELERRGLQFVRYADDCVIFTNTRKSYWRISNSPILAISLNNKTLERFGYTSLSSVYC